MTMKSNAREWTIREQIINDPVSGLTIQFEKVPNDNESPFRLRIFGNLPHGNRELLFGNMGERTGAGVAVAGSCRPTWLVDIGD
ncbi:MAG: hypothetical protein IH984_01875 [Planctomycetes bacterium]|nr:hypothetical protein [Planctomycetota bacterium]